MRFIPTTRTTRYRATSLRITSSEYAYGRWDTDFAANSDKVDAQKISASPRIVGEDSGWSRRLFSAIQAPLRSSVHKDRQDAGHEMLPDVDATDRQICGDFTVDLSGYEPKIKSDEDNTDVPDSLKTVTITTDGGTYGASAVFYIPMPVGDDYKVNVKLGYHTVLGNLEMSSCTSAKTLEMERGKIKIASLTQSTMHQGGYKVVYGHKFIDLGLSKMWADTNLGASVAADYGDYFSWAETSAKREYYFSDYSDYYDGTDYTHSIYWQVEGCKKYQDGPQMTLSNDDDAAYVVWGQFCKMPTKSEVEELVNGTTRKEASRKNSTEKQLVDLSSQAKLMATLSSFRIMVLKMLIIENVRGHQDIIGLQHRAIHRLKLVTKCGLLI